MHFGGHRPRPRPCADILRPTAPAESAFRNIFAFAAGEYCRNRADKVSSGDNNSCISSKGTLNAVNNNHGRMDHVE